MEMWEDRHRTRHFALEMHSTKDKFGVARHVWTRKRAVGQLVLGATMAPANPHLQEVKCESGENGHSISCRQKSLLNPINVFVPFDHHSTAGDKNALYL